MAKQTITKYDVENRKAIKDADLEVGDVIDAEEYNKLVGGEDAGDVEPTKQPAEKRREENEAKAEAEAEEADEDAESDEGEEEAKDPKEMDAEELDEAYSKKELKDMLEKKDLKVSGSKEEMIDRYVSAQS